MYFTVLDETAPNINYLEHTAGFIKNKYNKRSKHEEALLNYVLQTQQVSSVNKIINLQLLLDQEIADCILEDTPMPEYIMCQNNSCFFLVFKVWVE